MKILLVLFTIKITQFLITILPTIHKTTKTIRDEGDMSSAMPVPAEGHLLRNLTEYYLSTFLYDTAKFYAERMYYDEPNERNLNTWAIVFYRQGKIKQTYLMLKQCHSPDNRYLFAQCCVELDKLDEAEQALLTYQGLNADGTNEIPGGAAGLYLLGCICRRGNRRESAIDYFKKCLHLDSCLWSALVQLAEMGVPYDPTALFGIDLETSLAIFNGTTAVSPVLVKDMTKAISRKGNTKNKENLQKGRTDIGLGQV